MIELIEEYYMVGVACGAVSLLLTLVGGWVIIKGLETLKGDADEQSTASSPSEDEEG